MQFEQLLLDNNRNFLLAKTSEDWFPYCDNVNEAHKAEEMISIFENFSKHCSITDLGFQ
jgi:hypothetical protein